MEKLARSDGAGEVLAVAQAAVYVGAGLWPVVHLRSFEMVTGRKPEGWLVKTVGLLLASIGASLFIGRRSHEPAIPMLGVMSAASLAAIDVAYVSKRRISPVYALDAALQLAFVAAWTLALSAASRVRRSQGDLRPLRARKG
jgi:hypothetical protein